MGIKKHEHFENHMDVSSPETTGDAEKMETFSEDAYDDLFDKKLSYLDTMEQQSSNSGKITADTNSGETGNPHRDKESEHEQKRSISNKTTPHNDKLTMNSRSTLEYKIEHTDESKREDFIKEIETSAVGGMDGHRAHLVGSGKTFYVMHSEDKQASGRFSVKDQPDDDIKKRQEEVQAPVGNDCSVVDKVRTTKGVVAFESKVAPQPEWAEEVGYEAREGVTQTYIPLINGRRPINTDNPKKSIFEVIKDEDVIL